MLKTRELYVHLERQSQTHLPASSGRNTCADAQTLGTSAWRNSQPRIKGEQQLIMVPRISFATGLGTPKAKSHLLRQQLLHPRLKLANPALDLGRGNSAVH